MWFTALALVSLSGSILGAAIFHCPEGTSCSEPGSVSSTSFRFLDELKPKQFLTIKKLSVVNASLDKLPAALKYMKGLQYLDLSDNNIELHHIPPLTFLRTLKLARNKIADVSCSLLPKHLEELDLSANSINHLPQDWSALPNLKTVHLQQNPIDCDCYNDNVATYRQLVKRRIHIPEPITCELPGYVRGNNISDISCTPEDEMINDMPDEGSGEGAEDIFNDPPKSGKLIANEVKASEENEVIDDKVEVPSEESFLLANNTSDSIQPDEGSGDEGSGFGPLGLDHVAACVFDCATPKPVGLRDDRNDTETDPGATAKLKILTEDIFGPILQEVTPSTSTTTTTTTTTTEVPATSISSTSSGGDVSEETVSKDAKQTLIKEYKPSVDETRLLSEPTRTGEMEKATALNQNNYAVYLVVVCGLIIAVLFLVCFIKKRKSNRLEKNRHSALEEEMKPLEKAPIQAVNEQNGKSKTHIPEHVPLINGQNGQSKGEPILKSYVPLEHPESHSLSNVDDEEEPTIREKSFPELLTPHTERVTIRASEIPESIPKTPVLVHRLRNSDGEIITTVVPP
ncbi:protein windpipe-like [Euwallacea fornicatus]|uniref:protein windpipe-like n=1 Tax=Euwallacea fornicatus TaxID=995702 RepID=UPI00338E99F4